MKFYTNFFMRGNYVIVRGYDHGSRFTDRIEYNPTLYVPAKTQSNYQSILGQPLEPISLGSIKEARDFANNYKDIENFDIFGSTNYDYVCVNEKFSKDYDPELIRIVNIDIEVASEDGFPEPAQASQPVIAITASYDGHYYTFGVGDYYTDREDVTYEDCIDERRLLGTFVRWLRKIDPDVITGWNVQFFDIPYLVNRITKIMGSKEAKRLSPTGLLREREVKIFNRTHQEVELIGCTTLDYLELYKKFTYSQQESYRLDHIANVELGERKLDYSEVETLHQLYKTDYQKFIDYNIKDVELVDKLEEKMKLIEMAWAIAYDAKVNYGDVFTQVRMWDVLIHNWLMDKNIIIPPKKETVKSEQYAGAYVKEPQVGAHNWVMSFDLNSLYPHLIMQYNISPDTFVEGDWVDVTVNDLLDSKVPEVSADMCMAANGALFRKDQQGFLPEMMDKMYSDRVVAKKKMLESQDLLEKVNKRLNEL
jgi:DNA polymerase elongation subunit (family B)